MHCRIHRKRKNVIKWRKIEKVEIFCPNLKSFSYFPPYWRLILYPTRFLSALCVKAAQINLVGILFCSARVEYNSNGVLFLSLTIIRTLTHTDKHMEMKSSQRQRACRGQRKHTHTQAHAHAYSWLISIIGTFKYFFFTLLIRVG